jgi:hypothetical protein
VKILFAVAPGYGLMLPVVPLIWAARVAGHEILVATTSQMTTVGGHARLPTVDVCPDRDVWADLTGTVTGDAGDLPEEFQLVRGDGHPFGLFTLTMTGGTIAAGRAFGADLCCTPPTMPRAGSRRRRWASRHWRSATGSPGRRVTCSSGSGPRRTTRT